MNSNIYDKLITVTKEENVLVDEPMSLHTSFKVGGVADYFVIPDNISEVADVVRLLLRENVPYYVVGNGSNLLVSDKGYRGCIINIGKGIGDISVDGNIIKSQAGVILSKLSRIACENSLTGLEFASGIPGSVGGAIVMNAGAYGGEMKDVVKSVTLFDVATGEVVIKNNEEMDFGYRYSIVKSHPYIVLEVVYELKNGKQDDIRDYMNELSAKRRQKQPLEYPSAGSTFKRPEGYFAGKLIEDAGLKGYSVGGAMVSTKHSGFVINTGDASSKDIITLIQDVRSIVHDKFDVWLEPEVCMIGEDMSI